LTREEKETCEKLDVLIGVHEKFQSFLLTRMHLPGFNWAESELLFKLQELVDRIVASQTSAENVII
jgi:hypothetical protein